MLHEGHHRFWCIRVWQASCSWLNEIVPLDSVQKLVTKLNHQKGIKIDHRIIDKADHFFSSHIEELSANVEDYLDKHLTPPKRKSGRTREVKEAAR